MSHGKIMNLNAHSEIFLHGRCASISRQKRAYLEKAKECHPDRNPDDKAAIQFQRVSQLTTTVKQIRGD